jgi:RNase P/RNase MRP subunit POP5
MVRQKHRYLLVHFEFEPDILQSCCDDVDEVGAITSSSSKGKKRKLASSTTSSNNSLTDAEVLKSIQQVNATDIYRSLQESITQNFGLVGMCTSDVTVRLYDTKTRLAIIKTTRDKYPQVRSCLTFLTEIKQGVDSLKVVASTIAVSGSARTARNAAWEEVKKRFFTQDTYKSVTGGEQQWTEKSRANMEKELRELEECLDRIDSGC